MKFTFSSCYSYVVCGSMYKKLVGFRDEAMWFKVSQLRLMLSVSVLSKIMYHNVHFFKIK